jgi:hypothetical protein
MKQSVGNEFDNVFCLFRQNGSTRRRVVNGDAFVDKALGLFKKVGDTSLVSKVSSIVKEQETEPIEDVLCESSR